MLTLKKSLGQHFLVDESVSQRIVDSLKQRNIQQLVEIGPGGGALTKHLLQLEGIDFRCIEIDAEKVNYLIRSYPQLSGKVIHADVLTTGKPFTGQFTVVGNFPYNISTQIVFKIMDWKEDIESMTGMFQKEVAQRFASKEGSRVYGVTSVLIQAFFSVEYLFEVDEQAFTPPPKVKSAVIRLVPLKKEIPMKSARSFAVLVKTAFNQRRKTLRNAVKSLFTPDELMNPIFNRRAEELSVAEFGSLTFKMNG